MLPREIMAQERRLAELTFDQAPCRAFRIEPQDSEVERWIEVQPGDEGSGFLRHWLTKVAQRQLRSVGLAEQTPRVWTLALDFGSAGWLTYTLRAMGVSSWSKALFELPPQLKTWPEGVVLGPHEEGSALYMETDLVGVVLPVNGWTVLCFVFSEYSEYELEQLARQLTDGTYAPATYLNPQGGLVGLPRPALTLEFPATAPLEPIQFIPSQPRIELHPLQPGAPRLFKEHWILRLLNPPEKEHHHE